MATKTLDPLHESCFQTTNISKLSEQYRSKIKDFKHQTLRQPFPDVFFCVKMEQLRFSPSIRPFNVATRLRIRIDHVHEALRKHQRWQPFIDLYTLPETNVAPENLPSQKEISIPTIHFQGLC